MASPRRSPLLAVLALLLTVVGVVSTLTKSNNAAVAPSSLSTAPGAESTALYCTGLTGTKGDALGHVTFLNTTSSAKKLNIEVVANTGVRASSTMLLGAHAAQSIHPENLATGSSFAVAAQVNGAGVVGDEVAADATATTPCTTAGVTNWYGAGFDTTVGSSAILSIYNPTATAAVFNVATYSASGFIAPAPFQGVAIAAHAQVEIDLGTQIVNTSNIGVHVKVLRGSINIVGVQGSGHVTSFNAGVLALATTVWFPRVTTVLGASAQLRITNTNSLPVDLSASVTLANFQIAPQTLTLAPYASGVIVITPNSAIPAAGYATVTLRASRPVFTALATGTGTALALSAPVTPSTDFLVGDFSGKGYDAATVTNTGSRTIVVKFATVVGQGSQSVTGTTQLAAHTTEDILGLFSGVSSLKATTLLVTSSRSSLLVTTTLPSSPVGTTVVAPLDGR